MNTHSGDRTIVLDNVVAFLSRDDLATLATVSHDYSCIVQKYAHDMLIDKRWVQHRVGEVLEMPGSAGHDWRKTRAIIEECADALLLTRSGIDAYIARKLGATEWEADYVIYEIGECAEYGHVNAFLAALQYYSIDDSNYLDFVKSALQGDSTEILRLPEMRAALARMTEDEVKEIAVEISEMSVSLRTVDFFLSSLNANSLAGFERYGRDAIKQCMIGLVRVCLRHGIVSPDGDSIELAANRGYDDIVRLLLTYPILDCGIDVSQAMQRGYTEVVRLLTKDGRWNLRNPSYLFDAVQRGRTKIVAILLEYYSGEEEPQSYTHLIKSAVNDDHTEIVGMLLTMRGLAPISLRERRTMIAIAQYNGNQVILKMLREHK